MEHPSAVTLPGLSLATEELLALCDAVHVAPPFVLDGDRATEQELAVARHTLVARKLAVPHNGSVVVHPALGGLLMALAEPGLLVRVEVNDRTAAETDVTVYATRDDMTVEHRRSTALRVHHLTVVERGSLIERIATAAVLSLAPTADVPGFAVRSGALRAALTELERGEAGAALDALVGGGAPLRSARAFSAAVAARVRTTVVSAIWRERDAAMRTSVSWVDGGALGLWRIPMVDHADSALVEPVSSARVTAEIAAALPGRFAPPPRLVSARH